MPSTATEKLTPRPESPASDARSTSSASSASSASTHEQSSFSTFSMAAAFLGRLRRLSSNASASRSLGIDKHHQHENSHTILDPPPLTPVELLGYSARTKTRLMTPELAEEVRNLVPARQQLYDTWTLVYSLEQHGASLATLYSNNAPKITYGGSEERTRHKHGLVLVVKDRAHRLFGAYVNEHFHTVQVPGSRRFFGNGDCFLWTTQKTKKHVLKKSSDEVGAEDTNTAEDDDGYQLQFKGFPYTGVNDFVIFCTPQFLSMGGGDGHYGLWLDDNLEHGVSSPSLTFGNEPLSGSGTNFDIVGVEVWQIG